MDEFYIEGCENCTAHSGAYNAYLEARELTDDWAEVKAYVNSTVRSLVPRTERSADASAGTSMVDHGAWVRGDGRPGRFA